MFSSKRAMDYTLAPWAGGLGRLHMHAKPMSLKVTHRMVVQYVRAQFHTHAPVVVVPIKYRVMLL